MPSLNGLPASLNLIGDAAFRGCTALTTLDDLVGNLLQIGESCFSGCTALESIEGLSRGDVSISAIGSYAFEGCGIISLSGFPANSDGSITMGDYLFKDCTALTSIDSLPDTLENLGIGWFQNCTSLTSIFAPPANLKTIGDNCFRGCSTLTCAYLPSSLTSIGVNTFAECPSLLDVFNDAAQVPTLAGWLFDNSVEASKPVYVPESLLDSYRSTYGWSLFSPRIQAFSTTSIVVKNIAAGDVVRGDTVHIKADSFWTLSYGDGTIEHRHLSGTYDRIESHEYSAASPEDGYTITIRGIVTELSAASPSASPVFSISGKSSPITRISLANTIEDIGAFTFYGCEGVQSELALPSSLTTIGAYAFAESSITKVSSIPSGLVSIGESAFENCIELTIVDGNLGGDALVSLGDRCFKGCSSLRSIGKLGGAALTALGESTFADCSSLQNLPELTSAIKTIGENCFKNCTSIESISLPNSVESIAKGTFSSCISASSLSLGTGLLTIGEEAFAGCESIETITIPNAVTEIGEHAFADCNSATALAIGSGTKTVGAEAFYGCSDLSSVSVGTGLEEVGANAFSGCLNLLSVTTGSLRKWAAIKFNTANSNPLTLARRLYLNGVQVTSLEMMSAEGGETDAIENYVFCNCLSLLSLNGMPSEVKTIGAYCFSGCENLADINGMPNGVTSIGNGCFGGCTSIESFLYMPDSLQMIPTNCFEGCQNLVSAYIPSHVLAIGNSAFKGCSAINDILCDASTPPELGKFVFEDTNDNWRIYVPSDGLEEYKEADGWVEVDYRIFAYGTSTFTIQGDLVNPITEVYAGGLLKSDSLWGISFGDGTPEQRFSREETSIPGHEYADGTALHTIVLRGYVREIASAAVNAPMWRTPAGVPVNLTTIRLAAPLARIGAYAFCGHTALKGTGALSLPSGLKEIGIGAFQNCSELLGITLPDTLMDIGESAFEGCGNLCKDGSLTITDSIETIGKRAFFGCENITAVYWGNGVQEVGEYAFALTEDSSALSNNIHEVFIDSLAAWCGVDFANAAANPSYRGWLSSEEYSTSLFYNNGTRVDAVRQIEGATRIGDYAFYRNHYIKSLEMTDSVVSIGKYAFSECENLEEIRLGNGIKKIGVGAFEMFLYGTSSTDSTDSTDDNVCIIDVPSLEVWCNIDFKIERDEVGREVEPTSNPLVGFGYYTNKYPRLTIGGMPLPQYLVLPAVETIPPGAFSKQEIVSIQIPSGVDQIGAYAFSGCVSLVSCNIPSSVSRIGSDAFYNCNAGLFETRSIRLGDSEKETTFNLVDHWLLSAELPDESLDGIATWDLNFGAVGLSDIRGIANLALIPLSGMRVKALAFPRNCSIVRIGDRAFDGVQTLDSLTMENKVTSIGSGAFSGTLNKPCSVTIGEHFNDTYTNAKRYFGQEAFGSVSDSIALTIYGKKGWAESEFEDATANPLTYAASITIDTAEKTKTFSDGSVEYVGKYALVRNPWTSVNLPNAIAIHEGAFYRATSSSSNMRNSFGALASVEKDAFTNRMFSTGAPFRTINNHTWALGINYSYWTDTDTLDFGPETSSSYPIAIADGLFTGMTASLRKIRFTSQLTYIGSESFKGNTYITSVTMEGGGAAIGSAVLMNCTSLTEVILSGNIPTIGKDMFNGCTALTSIELPSTTTKIEEGAFANTGLTRIVIPASVQTIAANAFKNCKNLCEVVFEGGLTFVGEDAFCGCDLLRDVKVSSIAAWYAIDFANPSANPLHYADCLYVGNQPVSLFEEVATRDSSANRIGAYSFSGYRNFRGTLLLPNSVVSFGEGAFSYLPYVKSIIMGNAVQTIGSRAFEKCRDLESVTSSPVIETIGDYAFFYDEKLTSVSVPESEESTDDSAHSVPPISYALKTIGKGAFAHTGLTSIGFGPVLERIEAYGFASIPTITSVSFPASTKYIGDYAFAFCTALMSIVSEGAAIQLGRSVFEGCPGGTVAGAFTVVAGTLIKYEPDGTPITDLDLGDPGVPLFHSIADEVFADRTELESVSIPARVVLIGERAFAGCSSLETITIGNPEAEVKGGAFTGCSSLTSVTVPQSVFTMGLKQAFPAAFNRITSVAVPAGTGGQEPVNHIYADTFRGCERITTLDIWNFAEDGYIDGFLEGGQAKTAFSYCPNLAYRTYTEGDGEVFLFLCDWIAGLEGGESSAYDFDGSTDDIYYDESTSDDSTTDVVQPFHTKGIIGGAFANTEITSMDVSELGIKRIQSYTCYGCANLASIDFGTSIKSIGAHSFENCSSLSADMEFPSELTQIEEAAFKDCSSLGTITFLGTAISRIGKDAFLGIPEGNASTNGVSCDITTWCGITFDNGYANPIGAGRFFNGDNPVVIPDAIITINPFAFFHLKNSEVAVIGDRVETIGEEAFARNAVSEYIIKLGARISNIKKDAFKYAYEQASSDFVSIYIDSVRHWMSIDFENENANPLNAFNSALFVNDSQTTELIIPESISTIRPYTFYGWQGVSSAQIPSTVVSVSETAFKKCTNITAITVPQCICEVEDAMWKFFPDSANNITTVEIVAGTYSVAANAFSGYDSLTTVVVPLSVEDIDSDAFLNSSIATLTIGRFIEQDFAPDSSGIFDYFPKIRNLTILSGVKKIGAFACATTAENALAYVYIPATVECIGASAFLVTPSDGSDFGSTADASSVELENVDAWCNVRLADEYSNPLTGSKLLAKANGDTSATEISSLTIGTQVLRVRANAFNGCTSAVPVSTGVGALLSRLDEKAFNLPNAVSYASLTPNYVSLEGNAFGGSGFSSTRVFQYIKGITGGTPVYMHQYAGALASYFWDQGGLTNPYSFSTFVILESTTNVCPNATMNTWNNIKHDIQGSIDFENPSLLKNVVSQALPVSGDLASSTELQIPSAVIHLGATSFPGHVTTEINNLLVWAKYIWGNTLSEYTTLYFPDLGSSSDSGDSTDDVAYQGIVDSAFALSPYVSSLTASSFSMKFIGCAAFIGCENLAFVDLSGSGIEPIWDNAFAYCINLTSVNTGNSCTNIWDGAFYGCSALTNLNIGSSVNAIWDCAFAYCTGLTSVYIPASVVHIEPDAFAGCNILFTVDSENPVFEARSGKLYKKVEGIEYDVTREPLLPYEFKGNSKLPVTAIDLEKGLKNQYPSQYTDITEVVILEGVTTIPENAFDGCTGITRITIPASVTAIEPGAFEECSSLSTFRVATVSSYFTADTTPEPVRARDAGSDPYAEGGMLLGKDVGGEDHASLVAVAPASFDTAAVASP